MSDRKDSKKHARQAKKIRDTQSETDYSGEKSPYWEFLETNRVTDSGEMREHPEANPDVLSDEQSLYHQPPTEEAEFRIEVIKEMMAELSPQQKKIVQLCGIEGLSMRDAAEKLGMTLSSVRTLLDRARKKIFRRYEQRRNTDE